MIRFAISSGSAQLLFLASALKQYEKNFGPCPACDILFLYGYNGTVTKEMKLTMLAVAKASWSWHDVIWVDQFLKYSENSNIVQIRELEKLLKRYEHPDQFWFCMPHEPLEQVIMSLLPRVELHLFEDGLGTYVDLYSFKRLVVHPKRLLRYVGWEAARKIKEIVGLGAISSQYPIKPLSQIHLFLSSALSIPRHLKSVPCSLIHPLIMREVVESTRRSLSSICPIIESDIGRKSVLLIGQYYCGSNKSFWDLEYKMYKDAILTCKKNDYEVWWKEHPRALCPFENKLLKELCIQVFNVNKWYPIELFISEKMFEKIIAVSSTSLFTIEKLFGIEGRTIVDRFPFHVGGTFPYVKPMIRSSVKSFDHDFLS